MGAYLKAAGNGQGGSGLNRNELLRLMSPAVEWMMRVVGNGAGKDVFTPVLQVRAAAFTRPLSLSATHGWLVFILVSARG